MSDTIKRRITIVCLTLLLQLPLVRFHWVGFYYLQNLLQSPRAPQSATWIALSGLALLLALQLVGAFCLSLWAVRLWTRVMGPIRLQLQMRTILVLTLLANVLLFLNLHITQFFRDSYSRGFPDSLYYSSDSPLWAILLMNGFNVFFALFALLVTALFCERVLWRRPACAPPATLPPPESTLNTMPLTARERWLYALPMFIGFALFMLAHFGAREALQVSQTWRMNDTRMLGMVFRLTDAAHKNIVATCCAMLGLSIFYFKWVCQNRRAAILFNILLAMLCYLLFLVLALGIVHTFLSEPRCLRRRTRIGTPGGSRAIEDLCVGDAVLCLAPDGSRVSGRVEALAVRENAGCLSVVFDDRSELHVTAEHPLACGARWIPAGACEPGMELASVEGPRRVAAITPAGRDSVYDLTVAPHANFFANGLLVHNKLRKK